MSNLNSWLVFCKRALYFLRGISVYNICDLGEAPGDNIIPREILISLSSRRGLWVAF